MSALFQNPIVKGIVTGTLAAFAVDLHAFKNAQDVGKPLDWKTYAWQTAIQRWILGAILGGAGAAGLGLM